MSIAQQLGKISQSDGAGAIFLDQAQTILAGLAGSLFGAPSTISEKTNGSNQAPHLTPPELALSYQTLLEQIPAVVFMARLEDGRSEAYVSPHIESVLGFSREEWLDDPIRWYYQIHPDDRGRWNVEAASFVLSGKPLRSVYRVLARDGHVVSFQCEVKMVRRSNGEPWFIHGVGIDVTDLKNAEQELERARNQLELRVQERTAELFKTNVELESEIAERKRTERDLQRRAEELARSNFDLEQFAYSASHDLQEPIRNIAISAQILSRAQAERLDAEGQTLLKIVIAGAFHMESLIKDLLEYTHVIRAADESERCTDANQAVDTVLQNLEWILRETRTEIIRDPLPSVKLPGFRLQQIFQNLFSNAIKYRSDQPPRIHVSATRVDDFWLFSVQDNGIGINPEYHERIFGIFKRLHNREQYPGTGIGLAICKRIVEHAGGKIWVDSTVGQGAKFLFTVPGELRSTGIENAAVANSAASSSAQMS
jgi:PAS domain S-box-containing protein